MTFSASAIQVCQCHLQGPNTFREWAIHTVRLVLYVQGAVGDMVRQQVITRRGARSVSLDSECSTTVSDGITEELDIIE